MKNQKKVKINKKVMKALSSGQPVVALESTIITHGMPYPKNLETALTLEETISREGAVPATIAVIEGRLRIGLDEKELEELARGTGLQKISRRDLAPAVAQGRSGGTTVSGTMILAEMAGIKFFATGGIGGVHRGGEKSMDVSADLLELGQTSVAVISAGAKAILDLPRTLEVLETHGVPVIGYRTDEFPAFYYSRSGLPVPVRADRPRDIARILEAKWSLGLAGGVLIANPIPEKDSLPAGEVERAIVRALEEASRREIAGAKVTPFLLAAMEELTEGRSLTANVALVRNNARLAARIAREYTRL
ncbi:MAG: pseudouridine-5'-phosphate glycosidase [Candidatus Riflebacteria bacterium]|nr:pseudouridine-5'-phosphate glycosidase [Candidatus Riflebacteria bacterium]